MRFQLPLLCALSLLTTACDPDPVAAPLDEDPVVTDDPDDRPDDPLQEVPTNLSCVTVPATGVLDPQVQRFQISLDEDGVAQVHQSEGPLFHQTTDGTWTNDEDLGWTEADAELDGMLTYVDRKGEWMIALAPRSSTLFEGKVDCGYQTSDLVCWDPALLGGGWGADDGLTAHYDWATGDCLDDDGHFARNTLPIELVRETGFAECADVIGEDLTGGAIEPAIWVNARGTRFGDSTLFFADLYGEFEGADLSHLEYGYAQVSGSIDSFTRLPGEGACEVESSAWTGDTATCVR